MPDAYQRCAYELTVRRSEYGPIIAIEGILEVVIFKDIAAGFRYAKILIGDETGIRELYPLTGNEIYTLSLKNLGKNTQQPLVMDMEVLTINEDILPGMGGVRRALMLYLVEHPLFRALLDRPVGGFGFVNTGISGIVTPLLNAAVANHPSYTIRVDDVQESKMNFVTLSTWSYLQNIQYLATRTKGGPYYLYTDVDGLSKDGTKHIVNFRSLRNLVKQPALYNYHLMDVAQVAQYESGISDQNTILDYSIDNGDKIRMLGNMTSTNVHYYNYFTGTFGMETVTYKDMLQSAEICPWMGGTAVYEAQIANSLPTVIIKGQCAVDKNNRPVNTTIKTQNAFVENLQNQLTIRLTCFGDEMREVGTMIRILLPSMGGATVPYDQSLSGEWLITHLEHHIGAAGMFMDYLVVTKNAFLSSPGTNLPSVSLVH